MRLRPRRPKQWREAKLREWERQACRLKGPRKIPRHLIPPLGLDAIAVEPSHVEQATMLLAEHGFSFWQLGPLEKVCSRPEHDPSYCEV